MGVLYGNPWPICQTNYSANLMSAKCTTLTVYTHMDTYRVKILYIVSVQDDDDDDDEEEEESKKVEVTTKATSNDHAAVSTQPAVKKLKGMCLWYLYMHSCTLDPRLYFSIPMMV